MRFRRPSTGTILGALALFIALGGTALAATGSLVNIADPSNAAHVAHVDASGKLLVGDGNSGLTVDGTVTTRLALPSSFWRASGSSFGGAGCTVIATPPTGKAVILGTLNINIFSAPSGSLSGGNFIAVYNNTTCSGSPVWDVTPAQVGAQVAQFQPGVAIPSAGGLAAIDYNETGFGFEIYATGFTVPASLVPSPAAPTTTPPHGGPPSAR